jgi:hypothetical protein
MKVNIVIQARSLSGFSARWISSDQKLLPDSAKKDDLNHVWAKRAKDGKCDL